MNDRPVARFRIMVLALAIALIASACSDNSEESVESADSPTSTASTTTTTAAVSSESTTTTTTVQQDDPDEPDTFFPDIVGAEATARGQSRFDFDVTVSSPYDTADRYADAWRVLGPDGTELGVRELTHGHQNEQPFTRSLSGVEIPDDITEVTIEGRDIRNGWGGSTLTVELPTAPDESTTATASASSDDKPFTVSVRQFKDGEPIPRDLTCDGQDAPPSVTLTAVPDGTRSYALIVDDPDAPSAEPFVHWVLWGMPVTTREITTDQLDGIDGTNDFGQTGWRGPCPPAGDGTHTYRFRLLALSEATDDLPAGLDARELLAAVDDLILDEAVVTGTYER